MSSGTFPSPQAPHRRRLLRGLLPSQRVQPHSSRACEALLSASYMQYNRNLQSSVTAAPHITTPPATYNIPWYLLFSAYVYTYYTVAFARVSRISQRAPSAFKRVLAHKYVARRYPCNWLEFASACRSKRANSSYPLHNTTSGV